MRSWRPLRALLAVSAVLAATACVDANNAFDPDAPRELQAPGEIFGRVLLPGRDLDANPVTLRVFDVVQGVETEVFADGGDPFRTRTNEQAPPLGIDDDAGAAGSFSLAPLPPGTYRVSFEAHANGESLFEDLSFFVTLINGERARRDVKPPRADLGASGGTIEGSVEGAQPGKLFVVTLTPRGVNAGRHELVQTLSMSESGPFAFAEVPPGDYALQVTGDAYVPNGTSEVEVEASARASVPPLRLTVLGQLFAVADFDAAQGEPPFRPYLPTTTANVSVAPLALVSAAPPTPFVRLALADRFPSDPEEGWQPLGVGADTLEVDLDAAQPDGEREILGQLRLCFANQCSCEEGGDACAAFRAPLVSGVTSLSVVVDRAAPEPVTVELDGDATPAGALVINCAHFGSACPPAESAAAYSVLVEARALDRVGRVRGFAVTLDDSDPPSTFFAVDAFESVADFSGNAPSVDAVAGEHVLRVYAQDRAGNVGLLDERPLHVDVTPLALLDPAIALTGVRALEDPAAPGVMLQIATETTFGLTVLTDGEAATTARVRAVRGDARLSGAGSDGFAPAGEGLALGITGEHRESVAFVVDAADDAGNVVTSQEIEIVRWTRGSVEGAVEVEGQSDAAGARALLLASDGVTVLGTADAGQSTEIDGAGSEPFSLSLAQGGALVVENAPAGAYVLALEGPAPILPLTRPLLVRAAERDVLAEPLLLSLPRAGLRGMFALEGREGTTNNAGIQVTLFGASGNVVATGSTLPDGSYQLDGVPAGAGYSVIGFFPSFVQAEVSGITVSANTDNLVADDGSGAPTAVLLRALTGDFTLCAPTADGVLVENCPPLLFTNLETVQVGGTDLTGFTAFRISTVAFAEGDATPAFEDIAFGAGGAPLAPVVTLGAAGERSYTVYLQLQSGDGNVSDVLQVDIVFDQTPPASPVLEVRRGDAALLDGFTNVSSVKVTLSASANGGAPLGDACVRFADAAPGDKSGMTCGLHNTVFSIPLEDLAEGLHTAYAFACDRAGNCSAAPVSASIVFDQTAPDVPTAPGSISPSSGAGFSPDLIALQFDGTRFHVNSREHSLRVDAGTAAEPDAAGTAVPEIVAARFALDPAQLASATLLPASPFREAGGSMTLTTPSFVGAEGGDFQLSLQLADAAGNLTSAGALGYALRLDTTPPRAGVSVPSSTNDEDGAIPVSVTDLDSEVLVRATFFTDEGRSLDVSPASAQVSLGGTLLLTPAGDAAFPDGEYAVNVSSVDRAGNTALASRVVLVDRTAPSAPTPSSPLAGEIVTTQNPTYRWDAVTGAALFLVTVKRDGVVVRGPSAVYTNSLFESVALPRGNYTWEVEAIDGVGNASGLGAGFPVAFTVDDAAPTGLGSLALAAGGTSTADTTPVLAWSAATDPDGQTPQASLRYTVEIFNGLTFDALALSSTVTGGTGTIQLSTPAALNEGEHSWRVTVRDNGGNALSVVGPSFVVDSQAPLAAQLAPVRDPAGAPLVLRWAVPTDPDRVGVRLQVSESADFSALLVDSLQTDLGENITPSLTDGVQYFVRVASEDALGNREFASQASFTFDGAAPTLSAKPIVVLDPGGVELVAGALIVERNVSVRLDAGVPGESVRALVSNEPGCALPTAVELDTDNLPNTIAWTLAPGGVIKRVFARFVDDAGNMSACVGSDAFRSTGVIDGNVLINAGSTGLSLTGAEALGIGVRLSGGGLGADTRVTTTDASGFYRFEGVPISATGVANDVQLAKPELGTAATTVAAVADQTVSAPDVTMTLQASSISGTALLHANSVLGTSCAEPTNHSSVTLSLSGTAWTGEAVTRSTNAAVGGAYSFTGVPGGVYRLTASRDGYLALQGTLSFQVTGGTNVTGRDFDLFDQVAPEPPLINLASAAVTSQSSATISVDIAGEDATTPASNFEGYRVLRVSSGTGPPVLTSLGLLPPESSYDLALASNRTNRFVFFSQDCAGNQSDPVEVTVVHDSVAPGAPTDVRVDNRDGAVRVSWTARPDSEGVAGYRLHYGGIDSSNPDDFSGEDASQGASPIDVRNTDFFTLTGLTNESVFYVAVQAIDGVQDPEPNASPLSVRVIASPASFPLDVAATTVIPSGKDATTAGDRIVAVSASNTYVYTYDTRGELSLRGSLAIGGDRVWGSPDHHTVFITSKTDYAAGIKVVDVSDPTAPIHTQTFNTATRRRYHLIAPGRWSNPSGTRREHIYAVYEEEGTGDVRIHSFRSSVAGAPSLVDNGNSLTVPTATTCLTAPFINASEEISELRSAGDLAFLTLGGCLKVFKLSAFGTSFTQTHESFRSTAHGIRGTHVDMPYVYSMAQDVIRVQLVDRATGTLSDPTTPGSGDALAFNDASGEFNIGALASAGVLITAARGNLAVYDTSTISVANVPPASRSAPGLVATGFISGAGGFQSAKLELLGSQLMLFRRESTSGVVRIIEMGGPRVFERSADISSATRGRGGVVRGSTLARFVTDQTQLELIDLRDATAPGLLDEPQAYVNGSCSGSTQATCMLVQRDDSYAYVSNNSGVPVGGTPVYGNNLIIFDVSDPQSAVVRSVTDLGTGVFSNGFPSSEEANALAVFDDIVAVGIDYPGTGTPEGYVHFLDVRDRALPSLVNLTAGFDTNAGDVRGIALDGSFAYVGKGTRLCVIDLFDGAGGLAPSEVGCQVFGSSIGAVALRGTELIVAAGAQLYVFDASDPSVSPLPQLLVRSSPSTTVDLAANGLGLYMLSFGGSVIGFDLAFESTGRTNLQTQVRGSHVASSWPYAIDQAGFYTLLFNENITTRLLKQQ